MTTRKRSDLDSLTDARLDRYIHLYHLLTGDYGEDATPTEAEYTAGRAQQAQRYADQDAARTYGTPREWGNV